VKLSQIAGAVLECVPINFAGKTGVPDEVIFPERPIIDAPGHERAVCIEQLEHHAGYRHWVSIHIRNDAVTFHAVVTKKRVKFRIRRFNSSVLLSDLGIDSASERHRSAERHLCIFNRLAPRCNLRVAGSRSDRGGENFSNLGV